ncbi:DUF2306 domain-containing protein [Dyadobacter psychrotolerans]|uniref:DUF2306 domain-containing protein n=1 Tax=Dyadobacter psychrotolerans TaxID=2541721 RepID=A0A4R5DTZ9_9BACT|nr:DUF2306 domain-containing protein [Dyadobacter psychrotolerans]TDE15591.1 DUF2306 domain-containing protein [Dyadobacter psychrotolerans]
MFHSTTGLIHLSAAFIAMISGAFVLLNKKGGIFHKRVGYTYVISMYTLNITAFFIYYLFGKFGPFHALSVMSLICLSGGIIPAIFKKHVKNWLDWHYYFMNWSVVGLYAAFWAETLTRTLPVRQFWPLVFAAATVTAMIGSYLIRRNAKRLITERSLSNTDQNK